MNYCERLVATAKELAGTDILNHEEPPTPHQAKNYLAQNEVKLLLAREVLHERCEVAVRFDPSFFDEHSDDFAPLRILAKSFALAARLAAIQGDYTEAMEWCAALLDLSNAVRRGGLVVDFLVSSMIAGIAFVELSRIRTDLDGTCRQRLVDIIDRMESERESLEILIERDQLWEARTGCEDEPFDPSTLPEDEIDGLTAEQQMAVWQAMDVMARLPAAERYAMYYEMDQRNMAQLCMLADSDP
jgi:hypothetical protein